MPIKGIYWSRENGHGRDIHVLRGQSTGDLTLVLRFIKDDGSNASADEYLVSVADVTLKFTPLFKGNMSGTDFIGDRNGITVDTELGVVRVDAAFPINRKNNFIMEVEATNDVGGDTFHEVIRVQIHGSVSQVWLTPDQITVRPSTTPPEPTNYRFAVRAQFDDGVVGDLTLGHGVTWAPAANVGDDGKLAIDAGDLAGNNIFITATLPASLGGLSTPLGPTLHIERAWKDEPARPKASIVAGGGLPGNVPPDDAANILLLGDGFGTDDENSFNTIANTFVQHLKTNQLTRPFNLLTGSMYFWKTFFASEQTGISFRSEMAITDNHPRARPIPAALNQPPKNAWEPWELPYLLYKVGLPIPGDDAPARTPDVLREEWATLVTPDPTPNVSDDLVMDWKALSNRSFIEEQDGFPGMSYGSPPAANLSDTYSLDLHEDRAGIDGLTAFYKVLASDDGELTGHRPIGRLWAEKTFRFDNTDTVLLISSYPSGRAVNGQGYIALSTRSANAYIPVDAVPGKNACKLSPFSVPTDVSDDSCRTAAHELAHSFGANDEYVENNGPYTGTAADLMDANVQVETDAQITDPANPTKKVLSGDQIKWNWHRIEAAAVVNGLITPAGPDNFRVPVVPDISFRFKKDDLVLLRDRKWGKPLGKQPNVSPVLQVVSDPTESGAVVVTPAPGSIVILPLALQFLPGSLLFRPKTAPASVLSAAYPFAEMVAKNVKDAISTNRKPLTVVPCVRDDDNTQVPILDAGDAADPRTPVVGIPAGFASKPRIVGLYAGGVLYSCGIFHPAGQCMMREDHEEHAEFCAVCCYIIVDMIDPAMHSDIDLLYDEIYPQR